MATAPKFLSKPPSYIACWPGDDMVVPQYGGLQIAMPPCNAVAQPDGPNVKGSPYRFASAKDSKGRPIPGTVELSSIVHPDPALGGLRKEFDAEAWVEGVYSNRKDLIARGLTVVDSVEDIPQAMAEGRKKWEAKQVDEWQKLISDERQRREDMRRQGKPVTMSLNDARVKAAIAGLEAIQAKQQAEMVSDESLSAALGLGPVPAAPASKPAAVAVEGEVAERLYALAEKHDINLTKDQLRGLLKREAPAIQAVSERLVEAGIKLDEPL